MGQKVNPVSLRLQQTNREFDNSWYANYFYKKLLSRDLELQQYLKNYLKLVKSPEARLVIQYTPKSIRLSNFLCYPEQSRELRSKIFGISSIKRKKIKKKPIVFNKFKTTKRKLQTSILSQNQQIKTRKKFLTFLVDDNLWNKFYIVFSKNQSRIPFLIKPSICSILENQLQHSFYNRSSFFFFTKKNNLFLKLNNYSYLLKDSTRLNIFNEINNNQITTKYQSRMKLLIKPFDNKLEILNDNQMLNHKLLVYGFLTHVKTKYIKSNKKRIIKINKILDFLNSIKKIQNEKKAQLTKKKLSGNNYLITRCSFLYNKKHLNYFFFPCIYLLFTENKKLFSFLGVNVFNKLKTTNLNSNKKQTSIYNFDVFYKKNNNHKLKVYGFTHDVFYKKNNIVSNNVDNQYRENHKQNTELLRFLKQFITTLFVREIIKNSQQKTTNTTSTIFSKLDNFSFDKKQSFYYIKKKQYKKNLLKFFLIEFILYKEYNKNIDINFSNYFYQKNIKYLYNSKNCFTTSQIVPIFHTIDKSSTPLYFLIKMFFNENSSRGKSRMKFLIKPSNNFLSQTIHQNCNQLDSSNHKLKVYGFTHKNLFTTNKLNFQENQYLYLVNEKNYLDTCYQIKNEIKIKQDFQYLKYKDYLQHFLWSQLNINTEYFQFVVSQDWQSAGFLADEIVYFLERRVTFRRLKNKIIKKIAEIPSIRGIRITCSGRVGGKSKKAQRAKTECIKYGQTSRHTFSSRIDFAHRTARTLFGSVGIKVWICYN